MDNQTSFIKLELNNKNKQLNFDNKIQTNNFLDVCFDIPEQSKDNCKKCNFHEAECFDENFGWLCSKCYEWLCPLSN